MWRTASAGSPLRLAACLSGTTSRCHGPHDDRRSRVVGRRARRPSRSPTRSRRRSASPSGGVLVRDAPRSAMLRWPPGANSTDRQDSDPDVVSCVRPLEDGSGPSGWVARRGVACSCGPPRSHAFRPPRPSASSSRPPSIARCRPEVGRRRSPAGPTSHSPAVRVTSSPTGRLLVWRAAHRRTGVDCSQPPGPVPPGGLTAAGRASCALAL